MLNPSEFSVTIAPGRKWFRSIFLFFIAVIGGLHIYRGMISGQEWRLVMGGAILALALFAAVQLWRYRLVLTEAYIESYGWSTKRLLWQDVVQAKVIKRQLVLFGSGAAIKIPPDISRWEEVVGKLTAKLNGLPVLRLSGNTAMWSIADRDEEGRLVGR